MKFAFYLYGVGRFSIPFVEFIEFDYLFNPKTTGSKKLLLCALPGLILSLVGDKLWTGTKEKSFEMELY